jgi:hypothetical protein
MGLDINTYWLTDRQSQCDFDFDLIAELHPCGGGVEYLHRDPASRKRWRKGKSQTWDSKIWSGVPRDLDPRKTALPKASSIYQRQTRPLVSVILRLTVSQSVSQSVSVRVEPHLGLMTRYLLLFDRYSLFIVVHPLWREDGSVFCQSHCLQCLSVPFYNSSERTPRKTPPFFAKNACLLVHYLAIYYLLLLRT